MAGTAPIYMLSLGYDWLSSYSRWNLEYSMFIKKALNQKGKAQLIKYLKGSDIWESGGNFDYSSYPPKDWKSIILTT